MSGSPTLAPTFLRDRATALRRVVFGIYAGGLAIGTHWPRLELGDPLHPPDKMLHYLCFGGLAFFLWHARYLRSHLALALVGIAWTIVDEVTQAIPVLQRSFSLEDVVASSAGFCSATLLLWSMRPVGGELSRLRRERTEGLLDLLLSRPVPWAALASGAALGVAAGVPISVVLDGMQPDPTPFQAAVVGGLLGGATVTGWLLLAGLKNEARRMLAARRCLGCGESLPEGASACLRCGRPPIPGQFIELPFPGWGDVVKAYHRPVLGGIGMLLFLFVAWFGLQVARRNWTIAYEVDHWLQSLSKGMPTVIDTTAIVVVVALTIDRARVRFARRIEEGSMRCLACGQDLRGTPSRDGGGRCGECGAPFLRVG